MFALTTDDVLLRVRERIHDRSAQAFDDAELLRAADDALRTVFDQIRIRSEDRGLMAMDVAVATDVTRVEKGVWRYRLPEWMADIQLIEAMRSTGVPYQVPRASLDEKDMGRGHFFNSGLFWNWGAEMGTIELRGELDAFATMRLWFIRAIPPMCYAQGSGAATTTTLTTTESLTEGMLLRDRAYEQQQFQVVAGAANDLHKIVRCTAFTVSAGVATLTFEPALLSATSGTTQLSMLVPLDPQHSEYLCDMIALAMLQRQGSEEEMAAMERRMMRSEANFQMAITRRSSGEPPRLSSSRRLGR